MSDLLERVATVLTGVEAVIALTLLREERTRIADDLEALSQKTPIDAMVTALLEYADKLRKND